MASNYKKLTRRKANKDVHALTRVLMKQSDKPRMIESIVGIRTLESYVSLICDLDMQTGLRLSKTTNTKALNKAWSNKNETWKRPEAEKRDWVDTIDSRLRQMSSMLAKSCKKPIPSKWIRSLSLQSI